MDITKLHQIYHKSEVKWQDPIIIGQAIYHKFSTMVMLYSGMDVGYSGRYSIIGYDVKDAIVSADFSKLAEKLSDDLAIFDNCWFGYLAYELKDYLENFPKADDSFIQNPNILMLQFNNILLFDHHAERLWHYSVNNSLENNHATEQSENEQSVFPFYNVEDNDDKFDKNIVVTGNLASNMTKQQYLTKVKYIQQKIIDGDIYQANLTRKFYGNISNYQQLNKFLLFRQSTIISPAAYSSFIKYDDLNIISTSPEQFIKCDAKGNIVTRPIKGSSARASDPDQDKILLNNLKNSEKERAENLMIVDLMRNDLARSAKIGSVKVEDLFRVTSYKTIHHMDSTILATKNHNITSLEMVQNCFPPGSMTGAPKIRAMEICQELEQQKRGIYSGIIGYFAGDGSCDFSVVIRTLIIKQDKFELQVGGAITYDSIAEQEWRETIYKAAALCQLLNIDIENL
ncbi:MAG: anthranilate synthase component I family protein [Pseudomonadota bacterium]